MSTPRIRSTELEAYRARTYRTDQGQALRTIQDAIAFIQARGFVTLWPIKGIELPSLWSAVAGSRPVASEHDDPGHITWTWKDQMLDQRRWYYAKLLRGKATFVSLEMLPFFYALSQRDADLDDFRQVYRAGTLSHEALKIADAILEHGPLDTLQLRRRAGLSRPESKARFERGLTELQRGLWILPIGIAEAGAWRYAFIYELLDRWYPQIPSQAGMLRRMEAREILIERYLEAVGAASESAIRKVFQWKHDPIGKALANLSNQGKAIPCQDGLWATPEIVTKK
jgi:hypothetical protein